jgi:hypothetical protein
MGGFRVRAAVALVASTSSACGYPEYAFVPERDSAVLDVAPFDSTVAVEVGGDAAVDSRDAVVDSTIAETGDAETSTTDADSDVRPDALAVDTPVVDTLVATDTADAFDGPPTCALIEDLEDGNEQIALRCGRSGLWFTYNDGTTGGVQTPDPSVPCLPSTATGRAGSTWAAHTQGSGFASWGGGIGFHFVSSSKPYDLRPYTGIGFWARVGAGSKTSMRIDFPDGETDPGGGLCVIGSTTQPCFDHFGTVLTFDTTWKYYVVRFSTLKQGGWGWARPSFDPSKVFGLQLQAGAGGSFDLWLDDFELVP